MVDGRQGAECVEHLFGDPPRRRRSAQLDGDRFAGNEAVDELHDVEDRSRHVDIGAQGDRLGVRHTGAGQRPLEPELTLHDPVGTVDRQRHRRRTPQHPSLIAPVRHEHLVGLAHGDALEAQVRAPAQVGRVEPVTQRSDAQECRERVGIGGAVGLAHDAHRSDGRAPVSGWPSRHHAP